jgi:hypothetical protein
LQPTKFGLKKSTKVHKNGVKTGQKQSKEADCGHSRRKDYETEKPALKAGFERFTTSESGAGDATRTRDIFLGKEVLYQLSYTRNWCEKNIRETRGF